MIWKVNADLGMLNAINQNTMGSHLGIEFTEIGQITSQLPCLWITGQHSLWGYCTAEHPLCFLRLLAV